MAVPALLVFLEPDFGTALVLRAITLGMLFVHGAPWRHFVWLGLAGVVMLALVFSILPAAGVQVLQPYQKDRLTAFLHPDRVRHPGRRLPPDPVADRGRQRRRHRARRRGRNPDAARLPARARDRLRVLGRGRGARIRRRRLAARALHAADLARAEGDHVLEIDVRRAGRRRRGVDADVSDLHQHRYDHRHRADHRHPSTVHELSAARTPSRTCSRSACCSRSTYTPRRRTSP